MLPPTLAAAIRLALPVLATVVLLALPANCPAGEIATLPLADHAGAQSTLIEGPAAEVAAPGGGQALPGGRDGVLVWSRHHVDPIYTSCGIAGAAGPVFAGTFLNPPRQVEALAVADGSLDWAAAGTELFVDAARSGEVLAAVDFNAADSSAVISEWRPGSAVPLWTYTVHPCRSLVYEGWSSRKPVQVADDGSTIAVALTMYTPAGQVGRLFAFAAGSGTPIVNWPFPTGNVVATALSADGRYCAMAGWPTVYVYDIVGNTLRWSGAIGSGNDALAISADGDYLAWGWTTLNLRYWNGSSYAVHYTATPGGGLFVGQVAFSPGDRFAVAWDNGNTTPNQVFVEMHTLGMPSLLWHYDYAGTPASPHVDIPSQMLFSPDGQHLAVGSWGGSFPEIHVFGVDAPEPLYTLDTPGSIFDIDIVTGQTGLVRVAACGKSVHAGTGGRGADLYFIEVSTVTAAETAPVGGLALLGNYPNPFNPSTTIRYRLPAAGEWTLSLFDLTGRRVRHFTGRGEAGESAVVWDGRDESGRTLASGAYFCRLASGGATKKVRLLLLK